MRITWIDTETTDVPERNPNCEIIAYCLQVWDNGQLFPMTTVYLLPTGPVAEEAAKVNGYTPQEWQRRGAVRPFDMSDAQFLVGAMSDQIIGGHNTAFDVDMIQRTLKRGGLAPLKINYRKVDTQAQAQALVSLGLIQTASLVNVAKYFGIDTTNAHTADTDVTNTIKVWEAFQDLMVSGLEMKAARRAAGIV
jgi:DNA polymerase III alpha subunit (gram-positive type)